MAKTKWFRVLAAALTLALLIPAGGALASSVGRGGVLYVDTPNGSGLNLRSAPSYEASVIASYRPGTAVTVLQYGRSWYKVSVNYCVGYMDAQYLSASKPAPKPVPVSPKPGSAYAYVKTNGSRLNLRATPSRASAILGQYMPGTPVIIYETIGSWYRVNIGGQNGYVMAKYVSVAYGEPTDNYLRVYNPNGGSYVNLRRGAGTNYSVVQKVPVNVLVTALERGGEWTKVEYSGKIGYMSSYFLK
ncbi:MAG: SH3 domain-containing protein, partial [Oscillospiraceae bacterium]|nr:SH3 domain-containing protein [Oscillospiraceae bacterium]